MTKKIFLFIAASIRSDSEPNGVRVYLKVNLHYYACKYALASDEDSKTLQVNSRLVRIIRVLLQVYAHFIKCKTEISREICYNVFATSVKMKVFLNSKVIDLKAFMKL